MSTQRATGFVLAAARLAVSFAGSALVLALTLTGCSTVQQVAAMPGKAVTGVLPGGQPAPPDPAALQVAVQRFADQYIEETVAALEDYARRAGTPEAHSQSLAWRNAAGASAVSVATGPNPQVNLLDFLTLTTLSRKALDEARSDGEAGEPFQPWRDASVVLEANAWTIAKDVLTPEQMEKLRTAIGEWWGSHPDAHTEFFARPVEFGSLVRQSHDESTRLGSVFSELGLDLTAGLDPAVREVTLSRLFAERAMFTMQRMPLLLRWQIETLTDGLLREQQIEAALESATRLSYAAESASQTAALFPDRITAEREAILVALEAQEGRLRELSAEVSRTLAAGEKMSASLNTTLVTFDGLMKRFGVGEPKTSPPEPDRPAFDILDYAHTADQITLLASQLDALVRDAGATLYSTALDKRIGDLGALSARVRGDAQALLNHAFLGGAGLIVLTFASAIVYRRVGRTGADA